MSACMVMIMAEYEVLDELPPRTGVRGRKPKWVPDLTPCLEHPGKWLKFPAPDNVKKNVLYVMANAYRVGDKAQYLPEGTRMVNWQDGTMLEWEFKASQIEGQLYFFAKYEVDPIAEAQRQQPAGHRPPRPATLDDDGDSDGGDGA